MTNLAKKDIPWPPLRSDEEVTSDYIQQMQNVLSKFLREMYNEISQKNLILASDAYLYVGDPDTDGSWRLYISTSDLLVEYRASGTWTEKARFVV